jgi:hypothetical protein
MMTYKSRLSFNDLLGSLLLLGATEVLAAVEGDNNEELDDIVDDNEGDCDTVFFVWTDSRNPAPQYSNELPIHSKLQSLAGAGTEPGLKEFPQ